jgi:hypothetical protein
MIAVVVVAVGLYWANSVKPVYNKVVMTGDEFSQEYNSYHTDVTNKTTYPNDHYYNLPSLKAGDVLVIRDRVTEVNYSSRMGATLITLNGFGKCPALADGLYFATNLTSKYSVGDMVEITFHIVKVEKRNSEGTIIYAGEVLDEWTGPAREKSSTPGGISPDTIHKL